MKNIGLVVPISLMCTLGCSEEKVWRCPKIEDAVLVETEYVGSGPLLAGYGLSSFPHAMGNEDSFRALPDTTNGTMTIKYRRGDTDVTEIWKLEKLR